MITPVRCLFIAAACGSLCACSLFGKRQQADQPVAGPDEAVAQRDAHEPPPTPIDLGAPALPEGPGQAVLVRPKPKLVDRLRLPEMENLPSESDLQVSKQNGDGARGVIVRPPSDP